MQPLAAGRSAVEASIDAGSDREEASGLRPPYGGKTPARSDHAQRAVRELGHLSHSCQVEEVTAVRCAVSALEFTVVDVRIIRAEIRQSSSAGRYPDAVRPRVIRVQVEVSAQPALARELESVVALRAAVIHDIHGPEILGVGIAGQTENPPLVDILRGRARRI